MSDYAHAEMLVSTDWVNDHKDDAIVVIAEIDVDTEAYDQGHIPGAIGWNWHTQLCDTVQRDIISPADLEKLLGESGISNDTTIIVYGDNNNWFAAWALWQLKVYGHKDVRIMNGGRKKWLAENRELTTDLPSPSTTTYSCSEPDPSIRALRQQVEDAIEADNAAMVDVRSPDEFSGKLLAPPGLPETCQRGGHIPGAANIPWAMVCNEDGTFKPVDELNKIYEDKGVTPDKDIIAYCRIGERSSHQCGDGRCPFTGRVLWQAPRTARTAGNLSARRSHSRRSEHPLGHGVQRRRHVQARR